ncbi:MAG: hypothetical protein P9F19_01525 [Candidatus Contendobacter sp.]|nr:hypothetical protein [Candidatus Contendobacter sp.]MDG4556070.1 hypothetical protein [Candidatus Contendobacter sp.]
MNEYETKIDLAGEELPAIVEYESDGPGATGILIYSVLLRRCIKERGDIAYCPDGSFYKVTFPEFISIEIFPFLNGRQLKLLAEEINANLAEQDWDETMNEPATINFNFPTNYAGVPA